MRPGKKPIPRPWLRTPLWLVLAAVLSCDVDAAHRTPRPLPDAGTMPAPEPATGPVAPPAPAADCAGAQPWRGGEPYKDGTRVTHGTPAHVYECKPWPFSGWCPMAAYEPGKTDTPWSDAWIDLGACP
jgi:hypothetical protein